MTERHLRLVQWMELAELGGWELDLVENHLHWSSEIYRLFEIDPSTFGASYDAFLALVHPEDRALVDATYRDSVASRTPYSITHRLRMPDGRIKWIEERGRTFYEGDQPLRSIGTATEVTDKYALHVEKQVLLREIHHRVKNNLQIVSSLLYLQEQTSESMELAGLLMSSRARIAAMSLVHEQLYSSENLADVDIAAYARSLICSLSGSYGGAERGLEFSLVGAGFALDLERAIPCALVLNELLTNALKHAFPDGRGGRVTVRLDSTPDSFELRVRDDGVGMPAATAEATGLGLLLMPRLVAQIGATLEREPTVGTAMLLRIPRLRSPH